MRIGFFTDTYLPNVDGVVNSIVAFKKELEKEGHEVFIYTSGDRKSRKHNRDPHVRYYRSVPFPLYPQYKLALFPFAASRHAARDKIQIVHCHALASMGLAAVKASMDLGIPLVGTFHTLVPQGAVAFARGKWAKRLAWRITWRAIRLFYKRFGLVTAPTRVIADLLDKHGVHQAVVVPNGIDVKRFNPSVKAGGLRKRLGADNSEKIILVAGRLSFEKNVNVLIEAASILRKRGRRFKFVVTGNGPAKDFYENLVHERGLRKFFVFTGFVPDEELPAYYAACDVLATASTFETQGLSVLEAMASGKPVVAADAMALSETVKSGFDGFLFKPGDAGDCADKLERVLSLKKNDYSRFCRNARKTAESFSVPKSTKKLVSVYRKVLRA